jgi:presenilin enhancer 2
MDPTDDVMDNETKISVSRKMFYGGFFMLPWLWLVNYLLFRKYFQRRSTPPEVKWYARTSLLLFFVAFVVILIWVIIYQLRWRYWGEFGERISLVIPIGD